MSRTLGATAAEDEGHCWPVLAYVLHTLPHLGNGGRISLRIYATGLNGLTPCQKQKSRQHISNVSFHFSPF